MITGRSAKSRCRREAIARWRQTLPRGRAEPAPSQGGPSRARWPCEENPGITPGPLFSEGRTPCVRIARPCPCRGISLVEMVRQTAPGLTGTCLVQAQACFNGRAEPAPPWDWSPELGWPSGKGPGIGDFVGGTRSPRPRILAGRKPGHPIPSGWLKMSRWPREHMPRSSAGIPCGRAEPVPPRVAGAS